MTKEEDIIEKLKPFGKWVMEIDLVDWFASAGYTRVLRHRVRKLLTNGKRLIVKNGKWIVMFLIICFVWWAHTPMIHYFSIAFRFALDH